MSPRILVFDSGIGGLSILQHLIKKQPRSTIYYLADQAYFPYGEKPKEIIKKRLLSLLNQAINGFHLDCLVIACNTATSISLSQLRRRFNLPIIGVEPVVKPLAQFHNSLLLATWNTIHSSRFEKLIEQFQPSKMRAYSPPHLATAIEERNWLKINSILDQIKKKFSSPAAIGLSCTHYPLIKKKIQQFFLQATIIEPSEAVAKQASRLCPVTKEKSLSNTSPQMFWLTTGQPQLLEQQVKDYLNIEIDADKLRPEFT